MLIFEYNEHVIKVEKAYANVQVCLMMMWIYFHYVNAS